MTSQKQSVTVGLDTHGDTHHAAVVDQVGRHLGDHEFPGTAYGYRRLVEWTSSFGAVQYVGVEGTGTYGAALTRAVSGYWHPTPRTSVPDLPASTR